MTSTLVRIPNTDAATEFLTSLIGLHPCLTFTMELPENAMISFIGIEIIENGTKIETQVYRKVTNTGLLLHFKGYRGKRYKVDLLRTMLHRAYALSSETEAVDAECDKVRSIFCRLSYPRSHIESVIPTFSLRDPSGPSTKVAERDNIIIRISLLSKVIGYKISPTVQPLFVSRKLEQDLRSKDILVPRGCDPFGQRHGSRPLAGSNPFLSLIGQMRPQ